MVTYLSMQEVLREHLAPVPTGHVARRLAVLIHPGRADIVIISTHQSDLCGTDVDQSQVRERHLIGGTCRSGSAGSLTPTDTSNSPLTALAGEQASKQDGQFSADASSGLLAPFALKPVRRRGWRRSAMASSRWSPR